MELPIQVQNAERAAEDMVKQVSPPAEPEKAPGQPVPAEDGLKEKLAALQHKFDVLQGKYNAEIEPIKNDVGLITRLKGEVKALRGQLDLAVRNNTENTSLISDLRRQLEKKPEPAPVQELDPSKNLTADELAHLEREDLSGETLRILTKLSRAAQVPAPVDTSKIDELTQRVNQVSQAVETTAARTWEQRLRESFQDHTRYFGDQADSAFVAWLDNKLTAFSSRTNRDELTEALRQQDLVRVKEGIALFESTQKPKEEPKPRNPLESQIEPSQGHQGAPPANAGKKTYTMAEIKKFYSDEALGKYRGREKEAAALNSELIRATQEGRVTTL